MSKAKNTVQAARAQIARDTRTVAAPVPDQTQGALADRHVRAHTPDSLYGDDDEDSQDTGAS